MNLEQARANMVEQQIRPWEVLDQAVLDLLYAVPREEFVPAAYRNLAFADMEIPIGEGERMMAPKVEARLLQSLALGKTDRVLEVGTGSGYLTALLARSAAHVHSLEIRPALAAFGRANLERQGVDNVTLGNDPEFQWLVRSSADLGSRQRLDVTVRTVGALPEPHVDEYTAVDVRYAWQAGRNLELSATLQNLLDPSHPEFRTSDAAPSEIERALVVQARWSY